MSNNVANSVRRRESYSILKAANTRKSCGAGAPRQREIIHRVDAQCVSALVNTTRRMIEATVRILELTMNERFRFWSRSDSSSSSRSGIDARNGAVSCSLFIVSIINTARGSH